MIGFINVSDLGATSVDGVGQDRGHHRHQGRDGIEVAPRRYTAGVNTTGLPGAALIEQGLRDPGATSPVRACAVLHDWRTTTIGIDIDPGLDLLLREIRDQGGASGIVSQRR